MFMCYRGGGVGHRTCRTPPTDPEEGDNEEAPTEDPMDVLHHEEQQELALDEDEADIPVEEDIEDTEDEAGDYTEAEVDEDNDGDDGDNTSETDEGDGDVVDLVDEEGFADY